MKRVSTLAIIFVIVMVLCAGSAFAADGTEVATLDNGFGFAPVAAIVVICYLVAQVIKATTLDNKWLPVVCGIVGGALGVLAMAIMPEYPAQDYITAVAIGIVSGLAATGVNQIGKQLNKTT